MPALNPNFILKIKDSEAWSASSADPLTFEKQVVYVGAFDKYEGMQLAYSFSVDETQIDDWVKNFAEMREAGITVPAPLLHSFNPEDKRGEVVGLKKRPDKKGRMSLYADIKFDKQEYANKLRNSNVSLFAPPVLRHQDKIWIQPIQHIGLTDYPVIGDLEGFTIAASIVSNTGVKPMNLNAVLKKLCELLGIDIADDATDESVGELLEAKIKELTKEESEEGKEKETPPTPAPSGAEPIAASNNPLLLNLLRDNRNLKINELLQTRKISPHQAQQMRTSYAGLKIGEADGFDAAYNLALSNTPMTVGDGKTISGSQGRPETREKSAIVKDAEERAKKKQRR